MESIKIKPSDITTQNLRMLVNLTDLNLYINKIKDARALSSLTGLKALSLGMNKISDSNPLKALTGLDTMIIIQDFSSVRVENFELKDLID